MLVKKVRASGFTVTELLVVLIIIGVIAAISIPNLLGLYNYYQAKSAFIDLKSAIIEAQKQAKRRGKTCKIKLDKIEQRGIVRDRITVVSNLDPGERGQDYSNCLTSDRILSQFVELETNIPGRTNKITFSHKGNTTTSGTIKLSNDTNSFNRCLVISNGLGIIRTGHYQEEGSGSMASKCISVNQSRS